MVWGLRRTTGLVARFFIVGFRQSLKFSLAVGIGDFLVGGLVGSGRLVRGDLEGELIVIRDLEGALINPE